MKTKDIVIAGILLGIGAIVRYFSLMIGGPITSNLVIAFYTLAILLIAPKAKVAVGIGIVSGIICALISHSVFPPANLISEPVGALTAFAMITLIDAASSDKQRKDNVAGYALAMIGIVALIFFMLVVMFGGSTAFGIDLMTVTLNKIAFGVVSLVLLFAGLYLLPEKLGTYKAAITTLISTLASGLTFIVIAAFVIFKAPGLLMAHASAVDVFVMASLPIVIGCAIINMIIAQALYIPAKKALR
jgi:hypothetical protein